MNSKSKGILARVLMIAMLAFLALPTAAFAQNGTYQNGRWQREEQRREEQRRREERRRNRDDRRDDRWENNGDNNRRGRNNDGYGNYGGSFQLRQTALNAGFADGAKEGRKDRDKGERMDWRDESGFQKATRDYSSRLGDRGIYMTYYRQAFENGYKDGYAGY
jgi:Ni/Co efflux regulator RcnB